MSRDCDLRRNDEQPGIGPKPAEQGDTGQNTVLLERTPFHGIMWVVQDFCGTLSPCVRGVVFDQLDRSPFLHDSNTISTSKGRYSYNHVSILVVYRKRKTNGFDLVVAATLRLRTLNISRHTW